MIKQLWTIGMLAIALSVSGCADDPVPVGTNPDAKITVLSELPTPTSVDAARSTRAFFIGPFDKLQVEVFGAQDLQRSVQTDGQGRFAFPLAGTIDAAGKTTDEIARIIEGRLAGRYVRNPDVTVNLIDTVSQNFTVDGQVAKPGQYPLIGQMTLMRSVAAAGGVSEFAKLDDVLVFRRVDGNQFVGVYNLGAIRRGNYPDPAIYSNDIVVVGDSPQRRAFKDILQAAPLLSTPIILIGQQL